MRKMEQCQSAREKEKAKEKKLSMMKKKLM